MIKQKTLPLTISLLIGAASAHSATFVMEKHNQSFSIDGNNGAKQGQQIYLWNTNTNNANQNWVQLDRGNGYYSYKKENTNLCWDGGSGGSRRQPITLETCNSSEQDQQWKKVKITNGSETYRFEKRNASGWSIDGNGGAARQQGLYLWNSNSNNVNQQWDLIRTDSTTPTPTPSSSNALFLKHEDSGMYYALNSSAQLARTASSTSSAQGLEKVSRSGGFVLRAVGGDMDGMYAYEPSGSSRQEMTADLSAAEIFYEHDCGDGVVYFTSATTGSSLKNESNNMLSNGSSGDCGSSANEFAWVDGSTTSPTPSTPTPTPTTPTPTPPSGNAQYPSDLMENYNQWKITYPDGVEDKTLYQEENEYFYVNDAGNGIVFYAPIRSGNGTTPNSSYIRSELRERKTDGSADIYWTTSGQHVVYSKQAITHLPIEKSHLVATQIHGNKDDGIDDAMVLRLEDSHLFLSFNGGKLRDDLTIKTNYKLGTVHEVIFEVIDGRHYAYYSEDGNLGNAYKNGNASNYLVKDGSNSYVMDIDYDESYFKVGNYTQSNAEQEGSSTGNSNNYGEVVVYEFWVDHN